MLPNAHHAPAACPKGANNEAVAAPVALQLRLPEGAVVHRQIGMSRAAMPKTAIHEDCQAKFGEHEIGSAKQWLMTAPPDDAMPAEKLRQRQFRFLVAAPTNPRHPLRALGGSEDVTH